MQAKIYAQFDLDDHVRKEREDCTRSASLTFNYCTRERLTHGAVVVNVHITSLSAQVKRIKCNIITIIRRQDLLHTEQHLHHRCVPEAMCSVLRGNWSCTHKDRANWKMFFCLYLCLCSVRYVCIASCVRSIVCHTNLSPNEQCIRVPYLYACERAFYTSTIIIMRPDYVLVCVFRKPEH